MIILFGMAGSGKGTQGKALSEIFGWRALSMGQIIRDTGEYADIINSGHLISDEDTIKLVKKAIDKAEAEGFDVVLDGFPRNVAQTEWMAENLAEKIDGAIVLEVPKAELIQRLELRGRDDDKSIESIEKRFSIFEKEIGSILPILASKGVVIEKVDGVGEVEEVTNRLVTTVEKIAPDARVQKEDVNGGEIENSYGE